MTASTLIRFAAIILVAGVPTIGVDAARDSQLTMEILVDGHPLEELHARGATYVEARNGREYSIRLCNHGSERIAVALSVDGLNSIDATTTSARAAAKWILPAQQSVTIDGWQTSAERARRFFFTNEADSYGAWLGTTTNLGVIEAVVFHEAPPPHQVIPRATREEASEGSGAPSARSQAPADQRKLSREDRFGGDATDDAMAATGIGREVDNPVRRVSFTCASRPAAHLRIRYEYGPQLLALGVLPRPTDAGALQRRERAHGFTDGDFAPDPYAAN